MEIIEINKETCNQCGICAAECPSRLIAFTKNSFPQPRASAEPVCMRCGHCVAVCPSGSLTHREIPIEKTIPVQDNLRVSVEQCEQMLKSRRSVRAFKDKPVSHEIISRLINIASYAPTGHNNQEVEWLVMDKPEELAQIEKLGIDWIRWMIKNQPQMAAMFALEEMLKAQEKNLNIFLRGAPALLVAHAKINNPMALIDSATAIGYLDLAANSMGLGTCWAGFVNIMGNNFPPVKNVLALPEGQVNYGCIMLGYNKHKYPRIPLRQEPRIIWR